MTYSNDVETTAITTGLQRIDPFASYGSIYLYIRPMLLLFPWLLLILSFFFIIDDGVILTRATATSSCNNAQECRDANNTKNAHPIE